MNKIQNQNLTIENLTISQKEKDAISNTIAKEKDYLKELEIERCRLNNQSWRESLKLISEYLNKVQGGKTK